MSRSEALLHIAHFIHHASPDDLVSYSKLFEGTDAEKMEKEDQGNGTQRNIKEFQKLLFNKKKSGPPTN